MTPSARASGPPPASSPKPARLIYEYHALADPKGTATIVSDKEQTHKAKLSVLFFKILANLLAMGAVEEARAALIDYGLQAGAYSAERIKGEVERQLKRAESLERKLAQTTPDKDEKEEPSPKEIRRGFDKSAAFLMTYFKFQIDLNTIKPTTFAMMLDQANREIAAKLAAAKRII